MNTPRLQPPWTFVLSQKIDALSTVVQLRERLAVAISHVRRLLREKQILLETQVTLQQDLADCGRQILEIRQVLADRDRTIIAMLKVEKGRPRGV